MSPETDFDGVAQRAIAGSLSFTAQQRASGGIAAVSDGAERISVRAFGNAREGVPADEHTVFRIASMSKSFLAATALSLRDEGRLDLRAPVSEYLPHVRLLWQGEHVEVSCAQLLSNRSGLPEDNAWGDRQLGMPREEFHDIAAAGLRLALPPGIGYQYSNTGMALVGAALEAITEQPIEQLVTERFLLPLGLSNTAYDVAELPAGASVADGSRTFDEGASFTPEPLVGHGALGCIGGMFSTAADIAAWMRFLGSAFTPELEHPDVLAPDSRLEMQSAYTPAPVRKERTDLESSGYAYGLVVEEDRTYGRILQHSGGLPGWSSHMRWHAATGIGVVVFGSSDVFGAGNHAAAIMRDVLDAVSAPSAVTSVPAWEETTLIAERIDELLRTGQSLQRLSEFAASNVLNDAPGDVRDQRLRELTLQFGSVVREQAPLASRITAVPNAAELRWKVACEQGELVCTARLVGLSTPQLQSLSIEAA